MIAFCHFVTVSVIGHLCSTALRETNQRCSKLLAGVDVRTHYEQNSSGTKHCSHPEMSPVAGLCLHWAQTTDSFLELTDGTQCSELLDQYVSSLYVHVQQFALQHCRLMCSASLYHSWMIFALVNLVSLGGMTLPFVNQISVLMKCVLSIFFKIHASKYFCTCKTVTFPGFKLCFSFQVFGNYS